MHSSRSGKWMLGAFISLFLFNVDAAPPKLLGLDDMSCAAWISTKDNPDERRLYLAWARGFLSGHNYANQRQQVTDVSNGTIELYVDRFCRTNPKASFADALYRMSDEFSGRGTPLSK
ncbi:MAG: hypothetical protein KGP14_08570 [Betaproteobacteria bacterium]|nr:hypothetical protein [Betaproteobacteria bacterium]